MPAERWEHYLRQACEGDEEMLREVSSLLEGHRASGDFLQNPVMPSSTAMQDLAGKDPWVDRRVGRYRLLRPIGKGGMGAVYLAIRDDDEFQQRVALKLLRPKSDTAEIIRRFRTERQILAALDHPNIAKLLDGGSTEEGLPYFAMEYVEGKPLDEYCDSRRLDIPERLALFRTVCDAVHVAHQNLVVHRDLKPGNILVTGEGVVKLLDFGIAKLLNPELSARGMTTTASGMRLMTPHYASPEQVLGDPISTASDIYSLGVLLYRLLTGRLPYRSLGTTQLEFARVICEEDPTSPSDVVVEQTGTQSEAFAVGTNSSPSADDLARARASDPKKLSRQLSTDLDAIVHRALRKLPQERYASVRELAEDLHRHDNNLPVLAMGGAWRYRLGKYLRRHGVMVAVAITFILALLGFAVVMGLQRTQLAQERDRAEQERQRAESVTALLTDLFEISDPVKTPGETVSAREILDQGAQRLATQLGGQPLAQATLQQTVGVIYRNLGLYDRAGPQLETSLATRRRLLPGEDAKVAESLHQLGVLRTLEGDYRQAQSLLEEALALRRTLRGKGHAETAETLTELGYALQENGDYAQAQPLLEQALEQRRALFGDQHPRVAETVNHLAVVLYEQRQLTAAEALYREALEIQRAHFGGESPQVGTTLNDLAALLFVKGDLDEGVTLMREALALRRRLYKEAHPHLAETTHNLGLLLLRAQGDVENARPLLEEALAMKRQLLSPDHQELAASLNNLADVLLEQGDVAGAEPLAREAHGILLRSLPAGDWRTSVVASGVGVILIELGQYGEAERLLLDSYEVLRREKGESDGLTQRVKLRVVKLYEAWGKADEAARFRG